eukprot:gene4714-4964_t
MTVHSAEYEQQWHDHWKEGVNPGTKWDAGTISPVLSHLLKTDLNVQSRNVLVPGCGRGYDVFAFAEAGAARAVGLDLCPEAIAAAALERELQLTHVADASARSELVADNFVTYQHPSGESFDIGYDYTFLCALHPDMRAAWAESWARLIRPGGELITLIFPIGGNPPGAPQNPPWPVTPELYQELLLPAGFKQAYLAAIPEHLSHRARAGREWLGRWVRDGEGRTTCSSSSSSDKRTSSSTAAGPQDMEQQGSTVRPAKL